MTVNDILKEALVGKRVEVKVDGEHDVLMTVSDVVLDIDGTLVLYDDQNEYKRVVLAAVQSFEVEEPIVVKTEPKKVEPVEIPKKIVAPVKETKGGHKVSGKK